MGVSSWTPASVDLTVVAGLPVLAKPYGMFHARQLGICTADCDGPPRCWQAMGVSVYTH
jgi:hypothetical protein